VVQTILYIIGADNTAAPNLIKILHVLTLLQISSFRLHKYGGYEDRTLVMVEILVAPIVLVQLILQIFLHVSSTNTLVQFG